MTIEGLDASYRIRRRWDFGLTAKDIAHYTRISTHSKTWKLLLPSFLHTSLSDGRQTLHKKSLDSALQGLRGIAAVIVFHRHLLMSFSEFPDYGYGLDKTAELHLPNHWIHQLPFLRVLYSGGAMVPMFFIISGYTQSLKPLQQMQREQWDSVHKTLSSASFRRGFRLFLPTFAAAMLIAFSVWLGLYDWGSSFRNTWFDENPSKLPREQTLLEQVWVVCQSFKGLLDVWNWDEYFPDFNPQMWTIAVEYRCSLAVQFALLVLSMIRPVLRELILTSIIWYCHVHGRWDIVCFLAGLLLANINLTLRSRVKNGNLGSEYPAERERQDESKGKTVLRSLTFLVGLYFMGYPKKDGIFTPGYQRMGSYVPDGWVDHRFWSTWGTFLVVGSVTNSPVLANFFEYSLFQYLGKISYAMYLTHGPVLHITSHVLVPMMWRVTGRENNFCVVLGFEMATFFVTIPVLLWTADLFWRFVDVPCANFAFWLKTKALVA
ncbi:uncharacterized protein LY89DRAFT_759777 [Mollisia scopiformis]|uniref:Acyltransferase 3 domain-containing protein n=1 Tax=Mollisia scopiformis TaxID=149040 RepID=A0A194WT57_MOLSC|nr:uncharacterized protein LY89DRAFT_759777 [Mollisia scopiformis]KUJ10854.1 hypothetical protein LY89DRAFT_759777 [Mollisia scopiformis]